MHPVRGSQAIAAVAFAPALFLGACDRTSPPTAVDQPPAELAFTNGPPTAGPFLVRLADARIFFFSADEKKDRMSIHLPLDFCDGGPPRNLGDIQFVVTPSEVQSVLALITDDDGAVRVYGTADFTEAFGPGGPFSDLGHMCAFMNGPKKIAEGIARRVSAFSGESFSVTWTGQLVNATGDPVQYSEHHVFVIDPHTGERTITTSAIELHP